MALTKAQASQAADASCLFGIATRREQPRDHLFHATSAQAEVTEFGVLAKIPWRMTWTGIAFRYVATRHEEIRTMFLRSKMCFAAVCAGSLTLAAGAITAMLWVSAVAAMSFRSVAVTD